MSNRFEIHQDDHHGEFHWHLHAPNGEILCHACGFRTKEEAERAIDLVKEHAVHAGVEHDFHHRHHHHHHHHHHHEHHHEHH